MKHLYAILSLWILITGAVGRKNGGNTHHKLARSRKATSSLTTMDTEGDYFLRITNNLKNKNATSGEEVLFKCKINAKPMKNIQYTWYKDGAVISKRDHRFAITSRPWGTKLRIKPLYTFDSGAYRCEVSNGISYAYSSALLTVSFELPPPLHENEKPKIKIPKGTCEKYKGVLCQDFFGDSEIFVDAFENQTDMEQQIKAALTLLAESHSISSQCQSYALPAFCTYVFPICVNGFDKSSNFRLCKEDCEILKTDICQIEYMKSKRHPLLKKLFEKANCSHLPSKKENSLCVSIGLPTSSPPPQQNDSCYSDKGETYKGTANVAENGLPCAKWPKNFISKYPDLFGHNFCRNPDGKTSRPWCYVDAEGSLAATFCNIDQCKIAVKRKIFYLAVCGAAGALLMLVLLLVLRWYCVKRKRNSFSATSLHKKNRKLLEVDEINIRTLSELGYSNYGKVFQGIIVNDSTFSDKQSFAFKFVDCQHTKVYLDEFNHEIEILSKLNHPNITNLRGFCESPNMKCMVFEFTNQLSLQEYLVLNSPHIWKQQSDFQSKDNALTGVSTDFLIAIASQIGSAMAYLNSKRYIHRDLATRNVLMCGNMDVKISTVGFVKDAYLTNHHKTAHETLLPIRWMAPESLHSWTFSDKSTVWSFGVLLWEMFSYGLQPYCGYSNHEVLDMISTRQLLACPDQCPAKIYSLMQECWAARPSQRPSFTAITQRLKAFRSYDTIPVINSIMKRSADDVMHHSFYDDVNFSSVDGHVINQETACLLDPEKSSEFYPK